MPAGWADLTIEPDAEALAELRASWAWLLGVAWRPVLFSVWGDVFLQRVDERRIWWLNTGLGELTEVASDQAAFEASLGTDAAEEWFLPPLVDALHADDVRPGRGECLSYVVFPIFAEGRYVPENVRAVPVREHFGLSGRLHQELVDAPDGAQARIVVGP